MRRVVGVCTGRGYEQREPCDELCGDRIADICASRRSSGLNNTERAFWEGKITNHGLNENDLDTQDILDEAKESGVDINGKMYGGALAHLGPQECWVSGLDDIKAAAKRHNLQMRGSVNHTAYETEPAPPVRLAEDLIDQEIETMIAVDPAKALVDRNELREEVIERCAPKE